MEALHDLVKSGKVRYLGASSMRTWQFVRMNDVAEKNSWTKFVAMQDCYNLHYREEEREMIQYLQDQGIAQVPYSPLNKGHLTRVIGESTQRSESDASKPWVLSLTDADNEIVHRVHQIAQKNGVSMAQVNYFNIVKDC
jgi:aryl-alcohol dehydrogenase-like predicted oxidoreductase